MKSFYKLATMFCFSSFLCLFALILIRVIILGIFNYFLNIQHSRYIWAGAFRYSEQSSEHYETIGNIIMMMRTIFLMPFEHVNIINKIKIKKIEIKDG